MATPLSRAVFRRNADLFRVMRARMTPRRFQSSGSPGGPITKKTEGATTTAVPDDAVPMPVSRRFGLLSRALDAYGNAQKRRPWATQLVSIMFVFVGGDLCAQRIGGKEYDPMRTARTMVIAGAAAIPQYTWFMFLSRNFNYSSKILSIGTKVVINQIFFAPTFNAFFFGSHALLSGESVSETWDRLKRTVPPSLVNSVKLWPAVTAINFAFIPTQYRSIFPGFVAMGWQTYLSFLNRQAELSQHKMNVQDVPRKAQEVVVKVADRGKIPA